MIGIGTALADDPQLTARVEHVHHQPRRVVFDSLARLPLSSQLVCATADVPLIQKFDQHSAQELDKEKVAEWRTIIERQNSISAIAGAPPD